MKNPNFNPFGGLDNDPLLDLLAEGYEENAAVAFRDKHKVIQFPNQQRNSVSCKNTEPVGQIKSTDTVYTGYEIND